MKIREESFAKGGSVYSQDKDLQKLYDIYSKNKLSEADDKFVDDYIDEMREADDVNEVVKYIVLDKLEKEYPSYYNNSRNHDMIWSFTDEHLDNGLSGKQNYKELIEYLKVEDEDFAKGGKTKKGKYGCGGKSVSGYMKGKSHKQGGIPIEVEGGEVIINKKSVASKKKRKFDGKKMTNCQVLNKINTENKNGVKIDC